jgi:hypothetical protein
MVKQQETSNSLAGIKISSWKSCGQKPDLETFSPWDEIADEADRLLEIDQATRRAPDDDQAVKEQEGDQEEDRDETDTRMETVSGRRRPDSIAVEWKVVTATPGFGMRTGARRRTGLR